MAGVIAPNNRKDRRAAAATVPLESAITASAQRAAIEAGPTVVSTDAIDSLAPPAIEPPVDAAIVPEPTLVAEPGAPQPIVTASPILAAEPSALDVVQADAAAERVAAGVEPAPDRDGPHAAAAGQPTLTIEGSAAERAAHRIADGALGAELIERGSRVRVDDSRPLISMSSNDELFDEVELRIWREPRLGTLLKGRFSAWMSDEKHRDALDTSVDTVAVIEVVGPLQGRRRVGRSFGPQRQRFLASELTTDEVAALRADPLLAVGVSEVPAADIDLAFLG